LQALLPPIPSDAVADGPKHNVHDVMMYVHCGHEEDITLVLFEEIFHSSECRVLSMTQQITQLLASFLFVRVVMFVRSSWTLEWTGETISRSFILL